jgi:hypothetical protein
MRPDITPVRGHYCPQEHLRISHQRTEVQGATP